MEAHTPSSLILSAALSNARRSRATSGSSHAEVDLAGGLEARHGDVNDPKGDEEDAGGQARRGGPAELAAEDGAADLQGGDAAEGAHAEDTIKAADGS